MRTRSIRSFVLCAACAALLCANRSTLAQTKEALPPGAKLAAIEVQPAAVELKNKYEYAQLLINGRLESGEIVDVTRMVAVQALADVVTVSPTGVVRPKQDGAADVTFTLAGITAKLPVKVQGAAAEYSVNYIRDVMPVMSKLGCNAGTCHGSKEGKNGFKLSLRGYDPIYDTRALADDHAARRINRASPDDSLMLLKATGSVPHVGGMLTKPGENYYEILKSWIADGVRLDLTTPRVTGIELFPKNPIVQREGMKQQMRVLATYADGAKRDVTAEAFIDTGNGDVATTDRAGLVTVVRRGEAPILARFEGAYAATTVTVMGNRDGFVWEQPPANNFIDELVYAKLQRVKTSASPLCTDAEFLRRVYLDLIGLPPSSEVVRQFMADPRDSKLKRDELVDRLVGSPDYIDHRANKWADLLQVNRKFLGQEGSVAFRNWIKQAVASNMPYDKFAFAVLTASGSNRENPAASYYKILREPLETMENTTHLFLAVRFNCNKCHDHPFERWTQDQYYHMAAYFAQIGLKNDPASGEAKIGGTAVEGAKPLYEVVYDKGSGEVLHDRTGQVTAPSFPYQHNYPADAKASRREDLARWITSKDNQYFAKSYVNRMWGYLFGVGIIEPIDDIRAGNPPTNPDLLDKLTEHFVNSGFDTQDLLRTICKSRAYQLSISTNKWNEDDVLNYSHAMARRLPAEVLFDSVHKVTGSASRLPGMPVGMRAAQLPDVGVELPSGFLDQFGRPARESSCECERSTGLMLGPIMALVNGPTIADAIADPQNALAKLMIEQPDDRKLIDEMFVRILNRPPTEPELHSGLESLHALGADHQKLVAAFEAYKQTLPAKVAEWEKNTAQTAWLPLDPVEMVASNGATLAKEADLSILASGPNGKGQYKIVAHTDLAGITGVRIEPLADQRLPANGPGRASTNGNFVLSELQLLAAPKADPGKSAVVGLQNAQADFSQEGYPVASAIDGAVAPAGNGWAVDPRKGENRVAIFETKDNVTNAGGTALTFVLDQQFQDGQHSLGRFRLSVTTAPRPLQLQGPPAAIAAILSTPAAQRTAEQTAALLAHYQSLDGKFQELKQAVDQSAQQMANERLVGAQDLAWALINSPAFLFNR